MKQNSSLKDLIQSQLAEHTNGVVVVLPHLKRVDTYTPHDVEPDMSQLPWIAISKSQDGWICQDINDQLKQELLHILEKGNRNV
jgi:hypothetical protein